MDKACRNSSRRGFTLLELMIVIGIIVLLFSVLVVAVVPWLSRAKERTTMTVLQTISSGLDIGTVHSLERFRRDAGELAREISGDDDIAHSQMLLFYLAPSQEVWNGSRRYAGQNYNPRVDLDKFAGFVREEQGLLPYLVDAWENPFRYYFDRGANALFIISAGMDGQFETDDDLVLDTRSNEVRFREELK